MSNLIRWLGPVPGVWHSGTVAAQESGAIPSPMSNAPPQVFSKEPQTSPTIHLQPFCWEALLKGRMVTTSLGREWHNLSPTPSSNTTGTEALEVAWETWADKAIWNITQDFHHKYHITSVSISFSFLLSHTIGWHYLNSIKACIWFYEKHTKPCSKQRSMKLHNEPGTDHQRQYSSEEARSLLCDTCFVEQKPLLMLTWDSDARFTLIHHWSQLAEEKLPRSEPNKAWTGARTCG